MLFLLLLPIILISVCFMVNYIIASKFEEVAHLKGYDKDIHSFAMCFWLGIIGCLYVIALPDRGARDIGNTITNTEFDDSNTESDTDEPPELKKYNALVKKAEKFKDTFFDRDYRIRVYESIVKEMRLLANDDFMDASQKLEEYQLHLELLKTKRIR